jgi:hypothetical protein
MIVASAKLALVARETCETVDFRNKLNRLIGSVVVLIKNSSEEDLEKLNVLCGLLVGSGIAGESPDNQHVGLSWIRSVHRRRQRSQVLNSGGSACARDALKMVSEA